MNVSCRVISCQITLQFPINLLIFFHRQRKPRNPLGVKRLPWVKSHLGAALPWRFIVIKVLLPLVDVVTDTKTGIDYIKQKHVKWGSAILCLMLCPLLLILLFELFKKIYRSCCLKSNEARVENDEWHWTLLKIGAQVLAMNAICYFCFFMIEFGHLTIYLEET